MFLQEKETRSIGGDNSIETKKENCDKTKKRKKLIDELAQKKS